MRYIIIRVIGIFLISVCTLQSNCQKPPEAFFNGLDNFISNPVKAKQFFYEAVAADSFFFGSYNFLGILLAQEKKYDSSIYYLANSVRLNKNNTNHTKEMTLARLGRTYLYTGDFELSYKTALGAVNEFPDNPALLSGLRDICLWSYHVKYGGLSKNYLTPELKNEYNVNSVDQEYLIMRNITVNGKNLDFKGQSFDGKKNMDILQCTVGGTQDEVKLIFKLGWEVLKSFGDNMPDYKIVYEDKRIEIWYRLGAVLSTNIKPDLLKEIGKLTL